MKRPEIVTEKTSYFMLVVFKPREPRGTTVKTVYTTINGARKKAAAILENSPAHTEITIRQETVYCRDESGELSTNGVIESIKKYHNVER